MAMWKFDIVQSKSGRYYFRLLASNGQIILSSEMYDSKATAQAAIKSVMSSSQDEKNFERRSTTSGDHYFVLKSSDGRLLGKSYIYASLAARENGIWAVQNHARVSTTSTH